MEKHISLVDETFDGDPISSSEIDRYEAEDNTASADPVDPPASDDGGYPVSGSGPATADRKNGGGS